MPFVHNMNIVALSRPLACAIRQLLVVMLIFGLPLTTRAQSYPTKPVRLVVPFTPAGTTDLVARLLAQKLSEAFGQQVVVENRPGAGGAIGVELVARAAADGYTLVMGHIGTFAINPALYPKLPYDPIKDFAPIGLAATVPNMLVVHPSLPVKTVGDLVSLARSKPRQLNYGSGGIGAASHLAMELFKLLTKTDMQHIPYKGAGPFLPDLIAGQISLTITGVPSLLPSVQAGRLRAVAVASAKRLALLPDLPTIAEAGVTGYEATQWNGVLAPAATRPEVRTRLQNAIAAAMQSEDSRAQLAKMGGVPMTSTPEEFSAFIKTEIGRWTKVVQAAHIKPE